MCGRSNQGERSRPGLTRRLPLAWPSLLVAGAGYSALLSRGTVPPALPGHVVLRLAVLGTLGEMDLAAVLNALQASVMLLQRTAHRVLGGRGEMAQWRPRDFVREVLPPWSAHGASLQMSRGQWPLPMSATSGIRRSAFSMRTLRCSRQCWSRCGRPDPVRSRLRSKGRSTTRSHCSNQTSSWRR